ncbi:hypothetical protein DV738_g4337, partial [Chaetothyriales sp. CBS 135597]
MAMGISLKVVIPLLAALVIVSLRIRRFFIHRRFASRHGCQPVAHSFTRDPFLGLDRIPSTLRAVKQHRILEHGLNLYNTYGNTFTLQELYRSAILTIEPENIKTVLSIRFHDYGINYRLPSLKAFLGEGIFDTDGEHWAASRALIRPSFMRDQLADLREFEELIQDLFVLLPRDGLTVVDLQELFFRYTIDSATAFLFGQSVATLRKGEHDIGFAEAFHYAQNVAIKRAMLGPLSMVYRDPKADKCNRICRNFAWQFVEEAVEAVETAKQSKNSKGVEDSQPDTDTKHQKRIFSHELASRTSDKQRILDELMNVLLAGRDTTASLLSNMFFMLAKNPRIWHKVRSEVAVLQGLPPTYDELHGLKYVQCCVNESLRLHPVVPRNERQATRDTVLPLGGGENGLSPVFVPKGTFVCYNIYAMHRRTDIFGSDANEFRPERWEDGKLQPRWGYLPFSGGPRICIGQRYALTEASYVLVRMAQEFAAMESADARPWEESLTLTLLQLCKSNRVIYACTLGIMVQQEVNFADDDANSTTVSLPADLETSTLSRFDDLVTKGKIICEPSTAETFEDAGFKVSFRLAPHLGRKPIMSANAPERRTGQGLNPFLNPDPDFLLSPVGPSHLLLLNKYCVYRPSLLLITKHFAPQSEDLDQSDLSAEVMVARNVALRNISPLTHTFCFLRTCRSFRNHARYFNSSKRLLDHDSRIRNLGIIAHIDAGKTTTTERMLYYSGHTRRIGDVDEGSTVTDFLPAERARGITIQSAAITFDWPAPNHAGERDPNAHQINLIDTPGHADFTFEVRRSLRVLDGAICILDGVAGVEAQTEQVWNQAGEWKIPRIVYVNKLDRDGAAFGSAVREVGQRLGVYPAVCQIPWFEGGKGAFTGIVDIVNLRALKYDLGSDGKSVTAYNLSELEQIVPDLAAESKRARIALVERLSEHDEDMVERFLEAEDHLAVAAQDINNCLARLLAQESCPIVPIFAGASFRNIGVQPLLDAVNQLLPGPEQRPDPDVSIGPVSGKLSDLLKGDLVKKAVSTAVAKKGQPAPSGMASKLQACALAFKVVHDTRKGVLVYFRVYHGSINRNDLLFNTNLQVAERATNLLRMYASDSVPVQSITSGQIGVIAGSKHTRTGDTLICYESNKSIPPEPLNQLHLRPIQVPPPVFFAAIEPNSLREEKDVQDKLKLLLREDPSLCVNFDEDTGQTLLSGMGELHLEIANDRLLKDLKANARMGPIAIGYRETLTMASDSISRIFDKQQADSKGKAGCIAKVQPWDPDINGVADDMDESAIEHRQQDSNLVTIRCPTLDKRGRPLEPDSVSLPGHLTLYELQSAYLNGALAALSRGPGYSFPLRNVHVELTLLPEEHIFGNETTTSSLSAAARVATISAFRNSLTKGPSSILEPVMNVDISVDDASLGPVVQDISSRMGGHIISLGDHSPGDDDHSSGNKTELIIDVKKIYAPRDPFETRSSSLSSSLSQSSLVNMHRTVKARVPLKEMVGYLKHLRSMTGGRGTFVMKLDRFERVVGVREKNLKDELHGGQ